MPEPLRDRRRDQRHHRERDQQRKKQEQKADHDHDGDDELQREDEYAVSSKTQQQRAQQKLPRQQSAELPTPPPHQGQQHQRKRDSSESSAQQRSSRSKRDQQQSHTKQMSVNEMQSRRPVSQYEGSSLGPVSSPPTTEQLMALHEQNLEPYDVLFLSQTEQQLQQTPHYPQSSTPDVALQSQLIQHRMRATPVDHANQQHRTNYHKQHSQQQQRQLPNESMPPYPSPNSIHHTPQGLQQNQQFSQRRGHNDSHGAHAYQLQASRLSNISSGGSSDQDSLMGTSSRGKVSAKIQQLLNTLKKPKRRLLAEFYEDDDIELEMAANPKDPNAPNPEGNTMTPAPGPQLVIPAGLPRNLEAAIQRYGSATYKAPAATVLDPNGKLNISLTYGKLLTRSHKIAYALLNKIGFKSEAMGGVKPGDRVALVYPNNDPISFLCAFYGCIMGGAVPVPIEVPLTRRDAGSQQIGFLLGSCNVTLALTSESCFKGLPKASTGEVVAFKGWPKLHWFVTEHLPKPPKDWLPPPRLTDDTPAYVEYTTQQDGSVLGVSVTRNAMLAHARTLTTTCNYTEGEIMVCVLDFKREAGLWHSILASIFNGMHVIFVPYALMKVNPASWMQMVTRNRATVAICKSRDLHWGLLATKDHRELNLSSLRMLLVADGANPWSLSSCDQFLSVFQAKGLRPDAMCPCACSAEALTVSIRRPGREGVNATGRGVLSMSGLSYGVVRVDQENSLTSLTLQDCGQVLAGASLVVVKVENAGLVVGGSQQYNNQGNTLSGNSVICKTDEVGEICMKSSAVGSSYWGLPGLTNSIFRIAPNDNPRHSTSSINQENQATESAQDASPIAIGDYVRTGLLGFLGPGGLVFVCGSRDGLMTVTGRKHNTDDIIATVLAVEPMKFIYRGRIAVFSIKVLRDERVCVVAEQRPDCSEEESFQWMSRVLQAVDSIHQVGLYCLALVPHNHLPKTPLGGIHLSETRRRFIDGCLHPANVLMCPHTCVTNLPKPREVHPDVGK